MKREQEPKPLPGAKPVWDPLNGVWIIATDLGPVFLATAKDAARR